MSQEQAVITVLLIAIAILFFIILITRQDLNFMKDDVERIKKETRSIYPLELDVKYIKKDIDKLNNDFIDLKYK